MPSTNTFRVILASGAVLWRPGPGGEEIAVIRRARYGEEWSLPKGKLDVGESFEAAALREVEEETCCQGEICGFVGAVDYHAGGRPKVVLFYEMTLVGERPFKPNSEVTALHWSDPAAALDLLTYEPEKAILAKFLARRRSC